MLKRSICPTGRCRLIWCTSSCYNATISDPPAPCQMCCAASWSSWVWSISACSCRASWRSICEPTEIITRILNSRADGQLCSIVCSCYRVTPSSIWGNTCCSIPPAASQMSNTGGLSSWGWGVSVCSIFAISSSWIPAFGTTSVCHLLAISLLGSVISSECNIRTASSCNYTSTSVISASC